MLIRIGSLVACVVWLILTAQPLGVNASEAAVVLSKRGGVQSAFLDELGAFLPPGSSVRLVDAGTAGGSLDEAALKRADVVLAVGAEAADLLAARGTTAVVAVLLSSQNLRTLQLRYTRAKLGGIVLDQPLARHMRLIRAALPTASRVGVLFGPQSGPMRAAVVEAASRQGLTVNIEQIDTESTLLPALERLLEASDVILALPDPVVYSASTARPVLLTTYRYRKPLIGYSQAYVSAGALAAVHSAPTDVARQVAEWLVGPPGAVRGELPPSETPRHFSVTVNRHVARSLMYPVADESALAEQVETRKR